MNQILSQNAAAITVPAAGALPSLSVNDNDGPLPLATPATEKAAISVFGLGYVGAVSMACLAELGHTVVGVDVDAAKVGQIARGESPIVEDRLGDLLSDGVAENLVSATTDAHAAVLATDISFVSVGTPTAADGGCDFRFVEAVSRAIGAALAEKDGYHLVVMRCSVPPGTTLDVMAPALEAASGKRLGVDFGLAFNPEFLREGTAVKDFFDPPKTVIGATDERAAAMLEAVYAPIDDRILLTGIDVAEMVKYVDNVWHATKVCFANEIGRLCKPLGVDSHKVMDIFVQDQKLNLSPYYLKPGFAFGGSCLPKEVRAVGHLAEQIGARTPLIESLIPSNDIQVATALEAVRATGAKRVGVLGLAFKPGTDDMRESPILEVINALLGEGKEVVAFDPAIRRDTRLDSQFDYVRHACPDLEPTVKALPDMLRADAETVLNDVDAVVVTHRNAGYREALEPHLGSVAVVDVARLFDRPVHEAGYHGIAW